uniref:NADH-ubiquinone oxidoreductase chain 4L n=1 Tax=Paramacrosteles nigromaculatus TaxID=2665880 RepID=A0A5Q2MYF7_9HEMI|nr:NADH dehydrogenase subunit 4L [Paramacrosteles nigromaculatus]QGG46176.1 NADH dehydrogenase subunit 4L [Paramacrosteles nigromaculatus]
MFYSFIYMYVMSMFSLLIIRKHIFLCLLSLEFVVISLLMMLMYYIMFFSNGIYMMVIMMVFFVCEGVLGLSVLVSMIRCYGNDFINSMSMW